MIRFLLTCGKIAILSLVVLLVGQIHVGKKRICDYVGDFTQSKLVQFPVGWISDKFDHSKTDRAETIRAYKSQAKTSRTAGSDQSESADTERLSGLLKPSGH